MRSFLYIYVNKYFIIYTEIINYEIMASFITKNFLDNDGLKAFWKLIKQYIESASNDINNYTNELIGTLPEDSTTVVEAINNGISDAKSYADGLKTTIDTTIEENELITETALNNLNSRVEVLENGEVNYVPWENIVNKPVINVSSDTSSHTHTAEFIDTEGHIHTFSGISGTTSSIEDHSHTVSGTAVDAGGHSHGFTPTGNVSLIGALDGGVLTITAEFTGNSLRTESIEDHSHTVNGTTGAAGGHEHDFTPVGSINNAKATGTVTVNNETTHTHAVEIDLNNE
jgi:hypothetical protein